jgi:hypothetical protein
MAEFERTDERAITITLLILIAAFIRQTATYQNAPSCSHEIRHREQKGKAPVLGARARTVQSPTGSSGRLFPDASIFHPGMSVPP